MNKKEAAAALLRKATLTGEEVGKAIIANITYLMEYEQLLFTQEDMNALVKKVSNEEIPKLNNYIALSRWFSTACISADAHKKVLKRLLVELSNIVSGEYQQQELYRYTSMLPLIMTQNHYDKISKKHLESILTLEQDGFDVITYAIDHYLVEMEQSPRKANPIKDIVPAYEKDKVTSSYILTHYVDVFGQKAPDGLTKWELLTSCDLPLQEFYNGDTCDETLPAQKREAIYVEFYQEFKSLVLAVAKFLDKKYKLKLSTLTPNEWRNYTISAKEMYSKNICGYKDIFDTDSLATDELASKEETKRATMNGIAILHQPKFTTPAETFIDPIEKVGQFCYMFGLAQFTDDNPNQDSALADLDELITDLNKEIYYINGFKLAIDLIGQAIGMSTKIIYADMTGFDIQITKLCDSYKSLYSYIQDMDNGYDKHRQQKLDILESRLCEIDKNQFTLPEQNIDIAKAVIADFSAFKSSGDDLTQLLCLPNR